jgi:hypothetical protein
MSGFQGPFGPSDTPTILPGVTPTNGGAAGRLLFDTGSFVQESSGLTWDNTNKALTITGGTLTGATSYPVLNLSQAWNNAATVFTGLKLNITNTASAAGSLLMDLQVGGLSQFSVGASGTVTFHGSGGSWLLTTNGSNCAVFNTPIYALSYQLPSTGNLCFASTALPPTLLDLIIGRDAAGILALQNGTNAHSLRAYNTWSSAGANYERGVFDWATASNVLTIGTQAGGTGVARYVRLTSATKAIQYDTTVVASLPSAATAGAGARAFVTDALTPVWGAAVTGGGAVGVPVNSNGSTWNVG